MRKLMILAAALVVGFSVFGKSLLVGLSDGYEPALWTTNFWPTVSGVKCSYAEAFGKAGHTPVVLCRTGDTNRLERVIEGLDLLLMTGGEDVDPARYGETNVACGTILRDRDRFDLALIDMAVRHRVPVLGVCRGEQLINVYFGGTLCQDIPSLWQPATGLRHSDEPEVYAHMIDIDPGSRLASLLGVTKGVRVNSRHHQCVRRIAPGMRIVARAPDGVVEAIEHETLPVAGVQFHPEESFSIHGDELLGRIYRDPLAFVRPQGAAAPAHRCDE